MATRHVYDNYIVEIVYSDDKVEVEEVDEVIRDSFIWYLRLTNGSEKYISCSHIKSLTKTLNIQEDDYQD